jgi:hypothetical protein
MAQQSARRGGDNQGFPLCFEHATGDLDPVRETPIQAGGCRPAASKAGQMTASDHAPQRPQRFPLPERGRPQMDCRPSHQISVELNDRSCKAGDVAELTLDCG